MVGGDLALVANGEIYNFIELRRLLEARGGVSPPPPTVRPSFISTPSMASTRSRR